MYKLPEVESGILQQKMEKAHIWIKAALYMKAESK